MEEIITQLSAARTPVLAAVLGWLAAKLRQSTAKAQRAESERLAQQAALVDGVKSLLRGQIIDDGLTYLEEGAIPPFALETMEHQNDAYVRLGDGDKSVNDIVARCRRLPIRSGHE